MRAVLARLASPFSATVDTPLPADRAQASGTVGPWPRRRVGDDCRCNRAVHLRGRTRRRARTRQASQRAGKVLGTLERLATSGVATSNALGLWSSAAGRLPMTSTFEAAFDGTSGGPGFLIARHDHDRAVDLSRPPGASRAERGVRGRHVLLAGDDAGSGRHRRRHAVAHRWRAAAAGRAAGRSTPELDMAAGRGRRAQDRLEAAGAFGCRARASPAARAGQDRRAGAPRTGTPRRRDHRRRCARTSGPGGARGPTSVAARAAASPCRGCASTPPAAMAWRVSS